MKVQDLYETPMLIGDHEFEPEIDGYDLTDPDENSQAYKKIINRKKEVKNNKNIAQIKNTNNWIKNI